MPNHDEAEALAIVLEHAYVEGGLPRMMGVLLLVLNALRREYA